MCSFLILLGAIHLIDHDNKDLGRGGLVPLLLLNNEDIHILILTSASESAKFISWFLPSITTRSGRWKPSGFRRHGGSASLFLQFKPMWRLKMISKRLSADVSKSVTDRIMSTLHPHAYICSPARYVGPGGWLWSSEWERRTKRHRSGHGERHGTHGRPWNAGKGKGNGDAAPGTGRRRDARTRDAWRRDAWRRDACRGHAWRRDAWRRNA